MRRFLANNSITEQIEKLIAESDEFVYLISPYIYDVPKPILDRIREAGSRGVKITIIYSKGLAMNGREIEKLQSVENLSIFSTDQLHAKAYLSNKEAVVSSFNLLSAAPKSVEFGIYFSKKGDNEMFTDLLKEVDVIKNYSKQMRVDGSRIVEIPIVKEKPQRTLPEKIEIPHEALQNLQARKLSPNEKQKLIQELLKKENGSCVIKIEDKERLRLPGSGIVVFTSKERVELIFVRYATFDSLKEELKEYIQSQNPDVQIGVHYNRITFKADKNDEILKLYPTVKAALVAFELL
jgi:hypothetical protein